MRDSLECAIPPRAPLEGRHVLWMLLTFFGLVFAVNGYFLFAALSTYSGVVAIEPYAKGLAYNARIAAGERQTDLGWSDTIDVARDGSVVVTLSDRQGLPVTGLAVAGVLGRPSTAGSDRKLTFRETAGRYFADGAALADGNWIISIEAVQSPGATEPVYRARRRLWLKP